MSFKNVDFSQDVLSEEKFLEIIRDYPEKYFAGEKWRKKLGDVFVLVPGVFGERYFAKTTVSDVLAVCGGIDITWITVSQTYSGRWGRFLCRLAVANPKRYRGKLKFTPRNTLTLQMWLMGVNETNGKEWVSPLDDYPLLQDEAFINASVDNAYNNDDEGTDYDYISQHAFRMLYNDKRFCGDKGLYKRLSPEAEADISSMVHEMICRYYEIMESWAICYEFNENLFVFPMRQEFLKETLKGRDKIDGRRRVIPTVVKAHKRGNKSVSSHLRSFDADLIMDGRKFDILIGVESYPQIYPNNAYGMRKLLEVRDALASGGG